VVVLVFDAAVFFGDWVVVGVVGVGGVAGAGDGLGDLVGLDELWVEVDDSPASGEVDVDGLLSAAAADSRPPSTDAFTSGERVAEGAATYRASGPATTDGIEDTRDNVAQLPSVNGSIERSEPSFYELFLLRTERACQKGPRTAADIATELDVTKTQIAAWLKRAVAEKKLKKITRPVRYEWVGEDRQRSIF